MNTILNMPNWILNGARYAFMRWLDSGLVSLAGLDNMEDYEPEYIPPFSNN